MISLIVVIADIQRGPDPPQMIRPKIKKKEGARSREIKAFMTVAGGSGSLPLVKGRDLNDFCQLTKKE